MSRPISFVLPNLARPASPHAKPRLPYLAKLPKKGSHPFGIVSATYQDALVEAVAGCDGIGLR